jgi:predicted aldo/keto reductase-like oxidoreductase
MRISHSALMFRALDLGINYIDTARVYTGGNNERLVGEVLKDHRNEVYVATKADPWRKTAKDVEQSLHTSLKELGTDCIDVYQIHDVASAARLHNDDVKAFLSKAKEQGKIRFVGVSTHNNMAEVVTAAAEDGFYDTVLTVYNFGNAENKALAEALEKARKAQLGIIAMKTQQGGYKLGEGEKGTPHQAALRWVLSNPAITCAIPGVTSYEMLEENVAVMGTKLGAADLQDLRRYAEATASVLCRFCGECTKTCKEHIQVCESLRCLMYAEGYNDLHLAREEYRRLRPFQRADACRLCSDCSARCVKGLHIQERMLVADRILA